MIAPAIQVNVTEFSAGLARMLNDSRSNQDMERVINRIMAHWVSFAMNKMYAADRAAIKARLEARARKAKFDPGVRKIGKRGKESGDARYQLLRDSVAAYIVYATNWTGKLGSKKNGRRSVVARNASPGDFYALVGRYIGARQFSSGYLRSGLRPGLNTFRVPLGLAARDAKYPKTGPPGSAKRAMAGERVPMAEVVDWASGILEKFPTAFSDSLPEIEALVNRWITQNLAERAAKQGFTASAQG